MIPIQLQACTWRAQGSGGRRRVGGAGGRTCSLRELSLSVPRFWVRTRSAICASSGARSGGGDGQLTAAGRAHVCVRYGFCFLEDVRLSQEGAAG